MISSSLKQDIKEKVQGYDPLGVDEVDPSFIFLSPTMLKPKDFEALDTYQEPINPKTIPDFDYARQKKETTEAAETFIDSISNNLNKLETPYDKIFQVISSKRYRAGTKNQTQFDDNKELWRPIIEAHLKDDTPLEFVLPSFPYKFNTPFKVARKSPDMAEILCLSQMYEISRSLSSVHEPGVRFTIISDGQLYQSIFGITEYEAERYREQVAEMISKLEYDDHLDIVDMEQDVIGPVHEEFDLVKDKFRPVLTEWWEQNPDNERRASLIISSAPNINTAGEQTHDLVQLATKDILEDQDPDSTVTNVERVRQGVRERTEEAAFEFALVLYTLKELDLVAIAYPGAVRATVHPKPGQWGLHLVNEHTQVFPWQGVAYKPKDGKWTVKYESDVLRRRAVPVHIEGDMFPFYYEQSDEEPTEQSDDDDGE